MIASETEDPTPEDDSDDRDFTEVKNPSFCYASADDQSQLTVDGEKLAEAYESLDEGYWYEAIAQISLGRYVVAELPVGLYTRAHQGKYDDYFEDETILVDDDFWINKNQSIYIMDANHPDGENVGFEVTDVAITDGEGNLSESETIGRDDYNEEVCGWRVYGTAVTMESAHVTVFYTTADGEEKTKTISVDVTGDTYWLECDDPTDSELMLPGAKKTLTLQLYHSWKHSDEDQDTEEIKDYTLELDAEEESDAYDTDLISAVFGKDEDGYQTVTITANTNEYYNETNIALRAVYGEGSVAGTSPHVVVTNDYYQLDLSALEDIQVGEELNLTEMADEEKITLQHYVDGENVGTVAFKNGWVCLEKNQ